MSGDDEKRPTHVPASMMEEDAEDEVSEETWAGFDVSTVEAPTPSTTGDPDHTDETWAEMPVRSLSPDGPSGSESRPVPVDVWDRYKELGKLGEGGMGEVLRVRDRLLGREVAMKVLKPKLAGRGQAVARFYEEAQVASQLNHPGIVPLFDYGMLPDDRLYFTMKLVRGETLAAQLARFHQSTRREGLRRLVDVILRVCEAVGYAHHRGVLHRDLKPHNIMVGAFGEVQVMNWGLAKIVGGVSDSEEVDDDPTGGEGIVTAETDRNATRMGQIRGTPCLHGAGAGAG